MKHTYKTAALILAILMIVPSFFACGDEKPNDTASDTPTSVDTDDAGTKDDASTSGDTESSDSDGDITEDTMISDVTNDTEEDTQLPSDSESESETESEAPETSDTEKDTSVPGTTESEVTTKSPEKPKDSDKETTEKVTESSKETDTTEPFIPVVTTFDYTDEPETTSGVSHEEDPEKDAVNVKIVSLGDSICAGTGLSSPTTTRYSYILGEMIGSVDGYKCQEFNYGIPGYDTQDLIDQIKDGRTPELANADVVSISIGANNVLRPAINKVTEYFSYVIIRDPNLQRQLYAKMQRELEELVASGASKLDSDLDIIISLVRGLAPDAQIIVHTIYNPFENVDITLDMLDTKFVLRDKSDEIVCALNDVILKNQAELGYDVIDVYTAFSGKSGLLGSDNETIKTVYDTNPHPIEAGHRLIAELLFDAIKLD